MRVLRLGIAALGLGCMALAMALPSAALLVVFGVIFLGLDAAVAVSDRG
jgi:hypothetical protein